MITGKETVNATLQVGIVMCRAISDYYEKYDRKVWFFVYFFFYFNFIKSIGTLLLLLDLYKISSI